MSSYVGGTFKCDLVNADSGLLMIRHAFRARKQYLWVGPRNASRDAVLEAIRNYPKENARNEGIASEFHRECEDELVVWTQPKI